MNHQSRRASLARGTLLLLGLTLASSGCDSPTATDAGSSADAAPDAGGLDAAVPPGVDAGPDVDAEPRDAGPPPLPDTGPPTCASPDTYYRDLDGDGHGDPASSVESCDPVEGFVRSDDDCDDACDACLPGGAEACDGRDNDCDSSVDEGVQTTFYRDQDGDGHGHPSMTTLACEAPSGYVASSDDCDDACATCSPGRAELCDALDNDCDTSVDEGALNTFYRDGDGDGYGDVSMPTQACVAPAQHVADGSDCDDGCGTCYPGNTETMCDGRDDDCDSSIDERVTTTYYRDFDGDGYGVESSTVEACAEPDGYASVAGDCSDLQWDVYPGADEACNGGDDDCDGSRDETFACVQGQAGSECTTTCGSTGTGTCTNWCAPASPSQCTPPVETCNYADDDCDGFRDEGVWRWGSVQSYGGSVSYEQPVVAQGGSDTFSLWKLGGTVQAFRHGGAGNVITGPVQLAGSSTAYDAYGTSIDQVFYASVSGSTIVLQRLNRNLQVSWQQNHAITASQVRLTATSTRVYMFTVESAGQIRRRVFSATTGSLLAGPDLLGQTARPIDVYGLGGPTLLAFSALNLRSVELLLVGGEEGAPSTTARSIASPNLVYDVAVAGFGSTTNPDTMLVWAERGGAQSQARFRFAWLPAFSSSPVQRIFASGASTPNQTGSAGQRIGIEENGSTFFVGALYDDQWPLTDESQPRGWQIMTDPSLAHFTLTTNNAPARGLHTGLGVTYAQARLFYAPTGGGIENRWANCF